MLSFDAIGGRFIVGRARVSFALGDAIVRAKGTISEVPAMPVYFVAFQDGLHVQELDPEAAERKAVLGGRDTRNWYEGIGEHRTYLLTPGRGPSFVYVWCIVDCWRSFLFVDPEAIP